MNMPSIEYLTRSITHLQSQLAQQNRALPMGAQTHSLTVRLVYVTCWETQKTDRPGVYDATKKGGRWVLTSEISKIKMYPGEEISARHESMLSLFLTTNTRPKPFQASARDLAFELWRQVKEQLEG